MNLLNKLRFLLLFTAITLLFAEQSIEESRKELEKTQERIKTIQAKIDALDKQESGVLTKIDAFEEKINLTQKLVRDLDKAQKTKSREITNISRKINDIQSNINRGRSNLERILVNYYKMKRVYPLEVLLSQKSIGQVYQKSVYLRIIGKNFQSQIKKYNGLKQDLQLQQNQLVTAEKELLRLKQQRESERKNLRDAQTLEKKILSKVRNEKTENQKMESELKAAAAKLEKLIAGLEKQRRERKLAPGTHYLEIMKGKLPWPYYGEVIARFGSQVDPKYQTKTNNTGIDIKTPLDANVKAIANGKVVYADRFMGYGNMIIIDHSDGYYSLYSNLSELTGSVGMTVSQGEVIGKSRESLHFELRCEGKSVDPLLWLSR